MGMLFLILEDTIRSPYVSPCAAICSIPLFLRNMCGLGHKRHESLLTRVHYTP